MDTTADFLLAQAWRGTLKKADTFLGGLVAAQGIFLRKLWPAKESDGIQKAAV